MSQLSVPVCVPCARTMRCAKNDFKVVTLTGSSEPYQIYNGDKYRCEGCGTEVVVGFGAPLRGFLFDGGIDTGVPLKITDN